VVRLDRLDHPRGHRQGRWQLQVGLAGHPLPLLLHPDGDVTEFGTPGTPVGLVDHPEFHTVARTLEDEVVVLYTDGVTEARGADGFYGEARLAEMLAQLPRDPHAVVETVARTAVDYQNGNASDDIAVVALSSSIGDAVVPAMGSRVTGP
jgi:phosphoserine phosphatase RsbU/P